MGSRNFWGTRSVMVWVVNSYSMLRVALVQPSVRRYGWSLAIFHGFQDMLHDMLHDTRTLILRFSNRTQTKCIGQINEVELDKPMMN